MRYLKTGISRGMKEYNPFGLNEQDITRENSTDTNSSPFGQAQTQPGTEQFYAQEDVKQGPAPYDAGQGQFPQFQDKGTFSRDWQKAINSTQPSAEMSELTKKIEAAKNNGWGSQVGKFFSINRKRLALAAIFALFIFGGVQTISNKTNIDLPGSAAIFSGKLAQNDENENGAHKIVQELDLILDGVKATDTNAPFITKTAKTGEGITHLARYAIRDYLENTGKSLSAEQKIYAEDYIQNRMGSEMLEIGDSLSFSNELLNEAVTSAEGLEDWQIENLKQYSANVSLL